MNQPQILVLSWLPEGRFEQLAAAFPDFVFRDGRDPARLDAHAGDAVIAYGMPPLERLPRMTSLRWIQLTSAGVMQELCPQAQAQGVTVTNLAGLYGPSIAEHALALTTMLARNLHRASRNQQAGRWDRDVMKGMFDLHGRTLGLVGLGNIGQSIARLAQAYGMRVVGYRRRDLPAPFVDRQYALKELHALLAESDVVAVAAPLTRHTEGLLGPAEFDAMKPGVIYVNVSRGGVAQEAALLDGLRSGRVAGAGLDVFAVEPLSAQHPFWTMPNVIISPHYCGETINQSARPSERFARNLAAWNANRPLEGIVDLEWGY
jgi:phosphoglycerate dehydrogenase-like enzyme